MNFATSNENYGLHVHVVMYQQIVPVGSGKKYQDFPGIHLFPSCSENPAMPFKNKTKKSEIYWAIQYNVRPSPKENKTSRGGEVTCTG